VIVTGGAGFEVSSLVRELLDQGATVHVVDSLRNGRREFLTEAVQGSLAVCDIREKS
jgi:UDP-glucose 4-epimerase